MQKQTELILKPNELLIDITDRLDTLPEWKDPNEEKIVREFKKTPAYIKKSYNKLSLHLFLAKVHLRQSLEQICEDFKDSIVFDPIRGGVSTSNYNFRYNRNGLRVRDRKTSNYYHLYNDSEILLVDDLPVLFSAKLTKYKRSGKGNISVSLSMRTEYINHIFAPIVEYFNTATCGYVLFIPSDQIKSESSIQIGFKEKGAILKAWYTNRETYRNKVSEIERQYGL